MGEIWILLAYNKKKIIEEYIKWLYELKMVSIDEG